MINHHSLLSQAAYQIELPLLIPLENQTVFEATQLLRAVPNKRLVLAGNWQNQPAVAKLFMQSRRALKHYQRELRGLQALQKVHIKTPAIYHAGWNDTKEIYLIIYEYLAHAQPFSNIWENANAQQQQQLLTQLMQITAQLHTQGLYQRDCHLDNFMYESAQGIIMLDGATVVNQPHALNVSISLNNLAQLLAQFSSKNDHYFKAAFDEYIKLRGWQSNAPSFTQLETKILKWRNRRVKIYLSKALRTCTAFICEKTWDQFKIWDRDYDSREIHHLLEKPGSLFYLHGEETFQESNYEVLTASFNQYNFQIRRYPIDSIWQQLKYSILPSPARTAWLEMLKNRFTDKSTERPIALVEFRQGFWPKEGYLIIDNK